MQILVTSAESRACDGRATRRLGIPSLSLMENAGRGVVDAIERRYAPCSGKRFIVVCGKGNNGGDGFVAARHLLNRGAAVTVALVSSRATLKPDALAQFRVLWSMKDSVRDRLSIRPAISPQSLKRLPEHDFLIDAILGTGFAGMPDRRTASLIAVINGRRERVVSIDLPTGLNSDSGAAEGGVVKAEYTVTLCLRKRGLFVGNAATSAGIVEVADIGFPPQSIGGQFNTFLVEKEDVGEMLPSRPSTAHKHSVGKVLLIAGSRGMTGAAAMAALSVLNSGAGTAIVAVPKSIYPVLARKMNEVMVLPLPETSAGSLALEAYAELGEKIGWADVVIAGPGLSRQAETSQLVLRLLAEVDKPLVVDADALNAIAERPGSLRRRSSSEVILTPHEGEFSRLTGIAAAVISQSRIDEARKFARRYGLTLVLKGGPTVTATGDGEIYVNSTGNPGMATAGSGDLLTGIIGGILAQGAGARDAAIAGVYLHGLAGDIARDRFGERSLMAMDIHEALPEAIQRTLP